LGYAQAVELRHLRYFVAAAREENVTRAALRLHVSQPGVSRQISDLEEEIGFRLFERGPKSLRLTEAGRHFLGEAEAILKLADEAVRKAGLIARGGQGTLHVGYAPTLCVELLPRALRRFQSRFPKVRVALHDLSPAEMIAQLSQGAVQVALLPRPERRRLRGLEFHELARYPICAAVAPKHPLGRAKSVALERIAREPLIAYNRISFPEFSEELKRLFGRAAPPVAEEHEDANSVFTAVESGRGFALVPSCLAKSIGSRLRVLALTPAPAPLSIGIAWQKNSKSDFTEGFIEAARG
jgi:DNA-binding transcriptional LysR family regulator